MRKNGFSYLGQNSLEFGLRIEEGLSFESPGRDLDFVEIKGRDGDVVIDNKRIKMIEKSIPVMLFPVSDKPLAKRASDISNWLKQSTGYTFIEFLSESEYVYYGMIYEKYRMDQFLTKYGRATLNFKMMPYKFLKRGLKEFELSDTFNNPLETYSKPKITIEGQGDIVIKIGTAIWSLKEVNEGVILDTLLDTATSLCGNFSAWNKVISYPLPQLNPGLHEVEIIGDVTSVKLIPRWEELV